jgi:outer membrane receptor protein involved in Fe transport
MASDMADAVSGADIKRDDYGIARIKALYEPKAAPGLRIETSYVHTQSQSPQFEAVLAPFRERRYPIPERTNGIHRVEVDSFTTRIGYRLAPTIVSDLTFSAGDADIRRFGLPGLGLTNVDAKDLTAEATVRWRPNGRLSVLMGGHHLATRQRQSIDITGLGIGAGSFRDRQESVGLFGEAGWRPIEPLLVTGGLRYQRDGQNRFGAVGKTPRGIALDYDGQFDAWLPKLSVSYDFDSELTAGVLVQRSYNPGGTSISLARRAEDRFEAETLWNYEGFVRVSLPAGRGTFAANVFYNNIKNAQRQQLVPVVATDGGTVFAVEFANAPAARAYGLEAELSWRPAPRLSLRSAVGLLRTRVVRTVLTTDPSVGKAFQRSPRFSFSGGIDWRPFDPLRLTAQVRHRSGYFSDDANTPARRVSGATIVDLRSAYTTGGVTVFGYVRNVLDAFVLNYLFSPTFGTAEDPRELGAGVAFSF